MAGSVILRERVTHGALVVVELMVFGGVFGKLHSVFLRASAF